jgi:hypothetical protein
MIELLEKIKSVCFKIDNGKYQVVKDKFIKNTKKDTMLRWNPETNTNQVMNLLAESECNATYEKQAFNSGDDKIPDIISLYVNGGWYSEIHRLRLLPGMWVIRHSGRISICTNSLMTYIKNNQPK